MSSFTAPLVLEALPSSRSGRGEFLVYKSFTYEIGSLGSGDVVTVPEGFRTDLCSVPFFARAFLPIAGKAAKPALLHDWLVWCGDARAHAVFDEALRVAEVRSYKRILLVAAVRYFGCLRGWI